jgi:hypothetical protein
MSHDVKQERTAPGEKTSLSGHYNSFSCVDHNDIKAMWLMAKPDEFVLSIYSCESCQGFRVKPWSHRMVVTWCEAVTDGARKGWISLSVDFNSFSCVDHNGIKSLWLRSVGCDSLWRDHHLCIECVWKQTQAGTNGAHNINDNKPCQLIWLPCRD